MKTFDYKCDDCEFVFTFLLHKTLPSHCPKCNSANLRRLFSAPRAINYNGPGTARFRRGLKGQKPSPTYPLYCDEDLA